MQQAEKFILNNLKSHLKSSFDNVVDPKTKLQEYSLKNSKNLPIYKLISNTGPRHKPTFKVGVKIKNTDFIFSTGSSKQKAEQSAALELLNSLEQKMNWQDVGYLLSKNKYSENNSIANFFTEIMEKLRCNLWIYLKKDQKLFINREINFT